MKNTDNIEVTKHAWSGGSTPTKKDFENRELRRLRSKFFRKELQQCGGLSLWKFDKPIWPDQNGNAQYPETKQFERLGYYGTGAVERARLFWKGASLDAYRTLNHSEE